MEPLALFFIIIGAIFAVYLGYRLGLSVKDQEWIEKLPRLRQDSVKKSREVLTGQFSEQLAPYLPDFPFSPTECRFIGKPIDLIVFRGLDNKETEEVVFVEIKSGESQLSQSEKKLKETIKNKKVSWYEYRVSQGKSGAKEE